MKALFDEVSSHTSRYTTRKYSTSFSLGIYCLNKRLHTPIYNIYGFVRFADEIVDTFLDYDRRELLDEFREETWKAIDRKISLNPILNSFQKTVHEFGIERNLIECFLRSMEMDLSKATHSDASYKEYILGSAEVVGLMCLRVFTEGDRKMYVQLKPAAMQLGSAFQKVNFLRDMQSDFLSLGRVYFPNLRMQELNDQSKREIENDIEDNFLLALEGIKQLPRSSRLGVYVAYVYYYRLFKSIKNVAPHMVMKSRIRVPNHVKMGLLASSVVRHSMRMI